jgi:hypothetical protein
MDDEPGKDVEDRSEDTSLYYPIDVIKELKKNCSQK